MSSQSWSSFLWDKSGFETIPDQSGKSFYDLKAELPGKDKFLDMSAMKGKVVLVVNVASKCGFTPQYTGLEKLNQDFKEKGLVIVGFPCDQFAHQEPGTDDEIVAACQRNHGVTFQLAKKSDVNGHNMNPVYAWLKSQPNGKGIGYTTAIKWNFGKFLVGKDGKLISRYGSMTTPEALKADIEKALAQ